MMVPELQTLAQVFTERLLDSAISGVVLAALVWVMLRLTARQNSGTRFAIWFSVLLAIVALPFVSGSSFVSAHLGAANPAGLHRPILLSPNSAYCLFAAWAIGAGLLLLRLGVGLWRVRHFRKNCSSVDLESLDPTVARILREFVSTRHVKVCVSSNAGVPAAVGFFRPAIVFPAWLLSQLSAGEVEVILLHELAHLHRRDDWTNLAQKIVKAVFFFHPAVWWIENRLTLEREMACDDIVLAQTASPRAYASSLISFAEKLQGGRALALAQALLSRMHQMSERVAQILDAKQPRHTGLWKPVLGLSIGIVAVVVGMSPYIPHVVAFQPQLSPVQHAQAMPRIDNSPRPTMDLAGNSPAAERVVPPSRHAPGVRAISAAFHPRPMPSTSLKTLPPRVPERVLIRAIEEDFQNQQTIVILRTTQYDSSGSGVWTLCIWKVGNNPAERHLESAIFVSSI